MHCAPCRHRRAGAGVICFLLALGGASAQSAPGAPDGLAAVGRVHSLHVTWKPPATDGGSPVTSYVLRYISSAASDKSAENWTVVENLPVSANPEYTITGLIDEHAYDLEVRAVNAGGKGAWAAIDSQETLDNPATQEAVQAGSTSAALVRAGRVVPAIAPARPLRPPWLAVTALTFLDGTGGAITVADSSDSGSSHSLSISVAGPSASGHTHSGWLPAAHAGWCSGRRRPKPVSAAAVAIPCAMYRCPSLTSGGL